MSPKGLSLSGGLGLYRPSSFPVHQEPPRCPSELRVPSGGHTVAPTCSVSRLEPFVLVGAYDVQASLCLAFSRLRGVGDVRSRFIRGMCLERAAPIREASRFAVPLCPAREVRLRCSSAGLVALLPESKSRLPRYPRRPFLLVEPSAEDLASFCREGLVSTWPEMSGLPPTRVGDFLRSVHRLTGLQSYRFARQPTTIERYVCIKN